MSAIPFVPFANVCKVELLQVWQSQQIENVFHYQAPSALDAGLLEDAAAAAISNWDTNLRSHLVNSISLVKIKCTDLSTQNSPAIEYQTGLPLAGAVAENSVPNNVALVIKFITSNRGRSYRGRTYVAGLGAGAFTGSTLQGAMVAPLQDWGDSLLSLTVGAATWPLVIASRQLNKVVRTTGVATEVIGAVVETTADSQRRRLPGRGR